MSGQDIRLTEIWRYPVKSLGGERLGRVDVYARGLEGDRLWALVDPAGKLASGKGTRRFRRLPGLLHHRSHLDRGQPVITLADGRSTRADDPAVSEVLGAIAPPGWSLGREGRTPHFDAAAVHILTTATLASLADAFGEAVPVQRLRPNLLLDGAFAGAFPEDGWVGRVLRIGGAELRIVGRTQRCVMVGHPQAGLERRPTLLKTIGRVNGVCAGVYAKVTSPGCVYEGDAAMFGEP